MIRYVMGPACLGNGCERVGKCDKVCDGASLFREGDERVGKCDKVCARVE